MDQVIRALVGQGYELRETHISWVLLGRDRVYKIKKPVDFGFLDFRTPERRLEACEAEVRLNARLSDGVYLGVVPVTRSVDGVPGFGGEGETLDWAVQMKRLSDADSADARLAAGTLDVADVRRIADRIAGFHRDAAGGSEVAAFGDVEHIRRNVIENFDQTRESLPSYLSPAEINRIEAGQLGFLTRHADDFATRIDGGRIRDGHGDLRLEHVYLPAGEQVQIIDCIEFNDRFRYADVCADIAFLSMDLAHQGAHGLAEILLAEYARRSQDYDLYRFVDFYAAYRAFIRGKIATFLAADTGATGEARQRARHSARRYLVLSEAYGQPPLRAPTVYVVGGGIATGKTTLCDTLSDALGAAVIDSDRTRKHLAGVAATESLASAPFEGAYHPGRNAEVYAELLRRAIVVLGSGRSVIVEASFRSRGWRRAVRDLAVDHRAGFLFVECRAPQEVLRERLQERARTTGVSDGSLDVLDAFQASFEPVTELAAEEHLVLDTTGGLEDCLERVMARIREGCFPTGPLREIDPETSEPAAKARPSS